MDVDALRTPPRSEIQIADLDDTCRRQGVYINELEEYANSVEAANAELLQQVGRLVRREYNARPVAMLKRSDVRSRTNPRADVYF